MLYSCITLAPDPCVSFIILMRDMVKKQSKNLLRIGTKWCVFVPTTVFKSLKFLVLSQESNFVHNPLYTH